MYVCRFVRSRQGPTRDVSRQDPTSDVSRQDPIHNVFLSADPGCNERHGILGLSWIHLIVSKARRLR